MSGLWVVHEQFMSEWFLGQQIAGVTYSTLELHSLVRVTENKAAMNKLWENYERLMSGDPMILKELRIAQELQKENWGTH